MIIYYITHHVKIYGADFLYSQFHIGMPYILLCTSIYGPQVSITSPPYVLITFKNRKIMQMPILHFTTSYKSSLRIPLFIWKMSDDLHSSTLKI